jgi:hypothetical protein
MEVTFHHLSDVKNISLIVLNFLYVFVTLQETCLVLIKTNKVKNQRFLATLWLSSMIEIKTFGKIVCFHVSFLCCVYIARSEGNRAESYNY